MSYDSKYECIKDSVVVICVCVVLIVGLFTMKSCVPEIEKLTTFENIMETHRDMSKQELEEMFECFEEDEK